MPSDREMRQVLELVSRGRAEEMSLATPSQRAGWSAFHFQRVFHRFANETPKAYVQRLRLERGAALLLTSDRSVANVAFACGFTSHESFTRAFRRRFGISPRAYRDRGPRPGASHELVTDAVGPCIGLFARSGGRWMGPIGGALATFFAAGWAAAGSERPLWIAAWVGGLVAAFGALVLSGTTAGIEWIHGVSYAGKMLAALLAGARVRALTAQAPSAGQAALEGAHR
jgi:AraC-like DNA-binding protein